MLNYTEYIKKLKDLKDEFIKSKEILKSALKEDLETEFSKYLEKKIIKKSECEWFSTNVNEPDPEEYNIFLLEEDYGLRVRYLIDFTYKIPQISANTIFKIKGRFKDGGLARNFIPENQSIEEFVKDYIELVKTNDIIRKQNKEKRELKKMVKNYNI